MYQTSYFMSSKIVFTGKPKHNRKKKCVQEKEQTKREQIWILIQSLYFETDFCECHQWTSMSLNIMRHQQVIHYTLSDQTHRSVRAETCEKWEIWCFCCSSSLFSWLQVVSTLCSSSYLCYYNAVYFGDYSAVHFILSAFAFTVCLLSLKVKPFEMFSVT